MRVATWVVTFFAIAFTCTALVPPRFEWKVVDFAWENYENRDVAINNRFYIPEGNLPTGLARWGDKLFITIPRWKKGVPSSLNYVNLAVDGPPNQPLHPYPTWREGFLPDSACCAVTNSTVVSAFRPFVDSCNRLWVADNGAANMMRENGEEVRQVVSPSIMVFDLTTDTLFHKYVLPPDVLKDSSVLSSIVVDNLNPATKNIDCKNSFAYITDMGANAVIVYSLSSNSAWKVESPFFHFDPHASTYNVGGIEFFWHDGVSSAALGPVGTDGYRDLFLQPTSSTKLFKVSTRLLRNQSTHPLEYYSGVKMVGDRGPESQVTACDYDDKTNVLFYTQVSKNGVGCWSLDKTFVEPNHPVIFNDCNLLEFPNDINVDAEENMWVLSDRQHRFKQSCMDFNEINFRIFQISVKDVITNTICSPETSEHKLVPTPKETPALSKTSTSRSTSYDSFSGSGTSTSSGSTETADTENKTPNNKPKNEAKQKSKDDNATKAEVEAKPNSKVEPKEDSKNTDKHKDSFLGSLLGLITPVTDPKQNDGPIESSPPKKSEEKRDSSPKSAKRTKPDTSPQKEKATQTSRQVKQDNNPSEIKKQENRSYPTEPPNRLKGTSRKSTYNSNLESNLKVDMNKNIWILSDRQSRFLYEGIDPDEVNFRVFTAPIAKFIENTACESPGLLTVLSRAIGLGKTSDIYAGPSSQIDENRQRQRLSQALSIRELSGCEAGRCPILQHQTLNGVALVQQSPDDMRAQQVFEVNPGQNHSNIQSTIRNQTHVQGTHQVLVHQQPSQVQSGQLSHTNQDPINSFHGSLSTGPNEEVQYYTIPSHTSNQLHTTAHRCQNQSNPENRHQCGFSCCPIAQDDYVRHLERQARLNQNNTPHQMNQSQNLSGPVINNQHIIRSNPNRHTFPRDTSGRQMSPRSGSVCCTEEQYQQVPGSGQAQPLRGVHQGLRLHQTLPSVSRPPSPAGNQVQKTKGKSVVLEKTPSSFMDQRNLPVSAAPSLVVNPGPSPPRLPLVGERTSNNPFQESIAEQANICGAQLCGTVAENESIPQSCCGVSHVLKPECCKIHQPGDPLTQSCCNIEKSQVPLCCQIPGTNQSNQQTCCDKEYSEKPLCCKINQWTEQRNQAPLPPEINTLSQTQIGGFQPIQIFDRHALCHSNNCPEASPDQTNQSMNQTYQAMNQIIGLPVTESTRINESHNQPISQTIQQARRYMSSIRPPLNNTWVRGQTIAELPDNDQSLGRPLGESSRHIPLPKKSTCGCTFEDTREFSEDLSIGGALGNLNIDNPPPDASTQTERPAFQNGTIGAILKAIDKSKKKNSK